MATDGAGSSDLSLSEPQALFNFDGRYLRWFQSHMADFTRLQELAAAGVALGQEAVQIFAKLYGDFPLGEAVGEQPSDEQVQKVVEEARAQGLGEILKLLPQLIAIFKAVQEYWPTIVEIINLFKGLGGGTTPAVGGGQVNPGFIKQE